MPLVRTFCLLSAAGLTFLAGCGWNGYATVDETRASMAVLEASEAIEVRTRNGSVSIRKGYVDSVSISATLKARSDERLAEMQVTQTETDAGLVIGVEPAGGVWKNGEGASFEIIVPGADGVLVRSGNGAIHVEGLGGHADLSTSNGRITVLDHDGSIAADSSNGKLELERINGDVNASTSNGSITAIDLQASAKLHTSNGRVTARLSDNAAGPLNIRTSNGSVRVEVGEAFQGVLSASTSNGNLQVEGGKNVQLESLSKRRVTLSIGSAGPSSEIRTSNGSLTIQLPG